MSLKSISVLPLIFLARASTVEQSDSLHVQEELVRKWSAMMNRDVIFDRERFYALESGGKTHRSSVDLALAEVAAGRASGIVVLTVDRLGRSVEEICRIIRELIKHGGTLKGVHQPIDTDTPEGIAFLQTLGVFAELERKLINRRVRDSIASRRQAGNACQLLPTALTTTKKQSYLSQTLMSSQLSPGLLSRTN